MPQMAFFLLKAKPPSTDTLSTYLILQFRIFLIDLKPTKSFFQVDLKRLSVFRIEPCYSSGFSARSNKKYYIGLKLVHNLRLPSDRRVKSTS